MTYTMFEKRGPEWKLTGTPPVRVTKLPHFTSKSFHLGVRLGYPSEGTVKHAITVATNIGMSSRADTRPGSHNPPGLYQRVRENYAEPYGRRGAGVWKRRGDKLVGLNSPAPKKPFSGARSLYTAPNHKARYPLAGPKAPGE